MIKSKDKMTRKKKLILASIFIVPFLIFLAFMGYKMLSGEAGQTEKLREVDFQKSFPTPSPIYSIDSGNIVTVNPDNGETTPYYEGEKMYEAAVTKTSVAFIDRDYKLKYSKLDEPGKSTLLEESVNNDSLKALQGDSIFYLTPTSEVKEHDHKDDEAPTEHVELIYFVGHMFDMSKQTKSTLDYDGEPVKITNFALSPDRKNMLAYDIDNSLYIHSFTTGKTTKEKLTANRIGFVNNGEYWVTETDGSTGSTKTKLYSLKDRKMVEDLTGHKDFKKLSILDVKQVANYYVVLGNDYTNGSPQQLIYVSDMKFSKLEPVVNLTELGVNSNSHIYPTKDAHYFVDFRSSKENKAAALRISLENNSSTFIDKLSTLFTGPS